MRPAKPSLPPSPQVPTPAWREFKDLQEWEKYGQERPVGDKVSTFVDQLFDTLENFPGGWLAVTSMEKLFNWSNPGESG